MENVVHCKKENYDVYIGRPSLWGNPYSHRPGKDVKLVSAREEAITLYKKYLWKQIRTDKISLEDLASLDGKILGCWCAPKQCHGEVLLQAAAWAKEELNKK